MKEWIARWIHCDSTINEPMTIQTIGDCIQQELYVLGQICDMILKTLKESEIVVSKNIKYHQSAALMQFHL